ncbi:hypothetical protein BDA99DRAFT_446133, partial [Phascolomyces articulosus]
VLTEEYGLDLVKQSGPVWTSREYKPEQIAQFIALILNENKKIAPAARKSFKKKRGTVLSSYKARSEVKSRGNNMKLKADHSQFLEGYVEQKPTCIIKDATTTLCYHFQGLTALEVEFDHSK